MKDWIMQLCPEIAEWQAEIIYEQMRIRVEAEREACAKVCESKMPNPVQNWADAQIVNALRDCAAAIRSRKEKP